MEWCGEVHSKIQYGRGVRRLRRGVVWCEITCDGYDKVMRNMWRGVVFSMVRFSMMERWRKCVVMCGMKCNALSNMTQSRLNKQYYFTL